MFARHFDTSLVKFLAILLITNSHLDALYSDPRFATGGGLGNSLFFALAGLGLAISSTKNMPKFGSWMTRRLLRIYPQVAIVLLVCGLITGTIGSSSLGETILKFVWPTPYWFVAAIVVFYVPFYYVLRFFPTRIPLLLALFAIPYLWFYFTFLDLHRFAVEDEYFRWLFYFPMMLFGAYLAAAPALRKYSGARDGVLLFLVIVSYFALKFLISRGFWGQWQLLLHLLTFPFVFYSLRFFSNPNLLAVLREWKLYFWIAALGELSLEVYLIQGYWIKGLASSEIGFPLNVLLVWSLVFISAWPVSFFCKRLVGRYARQSITSNPATSSELNRGDQP